MKFKRAADFVGEMIDIYLTKRIPRSAAELSYYLTLSMFPLIICLHALLGSAFTSNADLLDFAADLIPQSTLDIITEYMRYISGHGSSAMLMAGLLLMASFSSSAFRSIHNIMADIQGEPRFKGLFSMLVSFLFSLVFLVVIYFSVLVMLTGNWLLNFIVGHFSFLSFVLTWKWLRFLLLFLVLLFITYGLFRITAPRGASANLMPGALLATVALVGVTVVFSLFIDFSTRYALVYGSLASIMMLMVWFFACGNILIMGNVFNIIRRKRRESSGG